MSPVTVRTLGRFNGYAFACMGVDEGAVVSAIADALGLGVDAVSIRPHRAEVSADGVARIPFTVTRADDAPARVAAPAPPVERPPAARGGVRRGRRSLVTERPAVFIADLPTNAQLIALGVEVVAGLSRQALTMWAHVLTDDTRAYLTRMAAVHGEPDGATFLARYLGRKALQGSDMDEDDARRLPPPERSAHVARRVLRDVLSLEPA